MSSCPGHTLEDYLQWCYSISENAPQFPKLVSMFEVYREHIEQKLADFNEEEQGWRSYASSGVFDITSPAFDRDVEMLLHPERSAVIRPMIRQCQICNNARLFIHLAPGSDYLTEYPEASGTVFAVDRNKLSEVEFEDGIIEFGFFVQCDCKDVRHTSPKAAIEDWNRRFRSDGRV